MLELGPFGFLSPWYFLGFLALPILWWLLRATPPRPRKEAFPGVRILLGLQNEERTPKRTPWWLLLLRLLAAALLLAAFTEPLMNPKARDGGVGPMLVVLDGGWTSAPDWAARQAAALDVLAQADEADRAVSLVVLAEGGPAPEALTFEPADAAAERLRALAPAPWRPDPARLTAALAGVDEIESHWLRDGLSAARTDGADDPAAELAEFLVSKGRLTLYEPSRPAVGLAPAMAAEEGLRAVAVRAPGGPERLVEVAAFGATRAADAAADSALDDPDAAVGRRERRLAVAEAAFAAGAERAEAEISLPLELRNALTRLEIAGQSSAGAVALLDDSYRRRRVAIVSGEQGRRDQPLLSATHYLRAAVKPNAETLELTLRASLGLPERASDAFEPTVGPDGAFEPEAAAQARARSPVDIIALADIGRVDTETARTLAAWVEGGGVLIRFAGPQLAAAAAEDRAGRRRRAPPSLAEPDLLPTALRGGGRALGGALSWSQPQTLAPFPARGPFAGLIPPGEVTVTRQVLAEPGPDLTDKVWAALSDGTPLVTAETRGAGWIVLFHVTANAEWSSLPLSGLFVDMLGRLVSYSSTGAGGGAAAALAEGGAAVAGAPGGAAWRLAAALTGSGEIVRLDEGGDGASTAVRAVTAETLREARAFGATSTAPPGVYARETAEGTTISVSVNAVGSEERFELAQAAPLGAVRKLLSETEEFALKPPLLAIAFLLLAADVLAALFVAGRLAPARSAAAALLVAGVAFGGAPDGARAAAEDEPVDPAAQYAALDSVFAYVRTGDPEVDRVSEAGLQAVSDTLTARTSLEPSAPAGVDLGQDDLAVYAVLYWPITSAQPELSDAAVRDLNQFMRTGGFMVVDTRDAHLAGAGSSPNERHLRRLLAPLDVPALEPMDANHLITRTFYIINGAPGRWNGGDLWVQAGTGGDSFEGEVDEVVLNDGVSSLLIGGADWASAWATDASGRGMYPLEGGEGARELARRFGVNIAMYAYTGSYKSDQVHINDLLERLGN